MFFVFFAVWSFLLLGRLKTSQADRKVSELPFRKKKKNTPPAQTAKKNTTPAQTAKTINTPPAQTSKKKAPAQTAKKTRPWPKQQKKKKNAPGPNSKKLNTTPAQTAKKNTPPGPNSNKKTPSAQTAKKARPRPKQHKNEHAHCPNSQKKKTTGRGGGFFIFCRLGGVVFFFLLFGRGPRPRPNRKKKNTLRPNSKKNNPKAQTTKKTRQQKNAHSYRIRAVCNLLFMHSHVFAGASRAHRYSEFSVLLAKLWGGQLFCLGCLHLSLLFAFLATRLRPQRSESSSQVGYRGRKVPKAVPPAAAGWCQLPTTVLSGLRAQTKHDGAEPCLRPCLGLQPPFLLPGLGNGGCCSGADAWASVLTELSDWESEMSEGRRCRGVCRSRGAGLLLSMYLVNL